MCGKCQRQCFQFVYTNKIEDDVCKKVFKDKNESLLAKKDKVRKLISAKKHTQKKLNNLFQDKHINKENILTGEFVVEVRTKTQQRQNMVRSPSIQQCTRNQQ